MNKVSWEHYDDSIVQISDGGSAVHPSKVRVGRWCVSVAECYDAYNCCVLSIGVE